MKVFLTEYDAEIKVSEIDLFENKTLSNRPWMKWTLLDADRRVDKRDAHSDKIDLINIYI